MCGFCLFFYADCGVRRTIGGADELAECWEECIEHTEKRMLAV